MRFIVLFAVLLGGLGFANSESNYRGLIVAHIVEPNGHVYRGYDGFLNSGHFENKTVIYFEQERGQKIAFSGGKIFIDSSTANKYYMTLEIIERAGEKFKADVRFFENKLEYQKIKQDYVVVAREIKEAIISGALNGENTYSFVDNDQPNFKLSINIDRIFSKEEILESLKKKLEAGRVQQANAE